MLQRLRSRFNREEGFTLIELLVVILIIGILAAIAIPSFLNQRGKGEDASAKSGARTVQTAFETFVTDNDTYNCGVDAATCVGALNDIESQLPAAGSDEGEITAISGDATSWTVTVEGGDNRTYTIARGATGAVTRTCDVPADTNIGGCPGAVAGGADGTW